VTATDLSPAMLEVVKKVASHHGVFVETAVSSAEDLSAFLTNSFDVVYAANTLHHVDIGKCLDEVKRVLKPGGFLGLACA
jgi:ubiquinone/menaquinone biosynthesis C-methylase UbiE